MYFLVGLALGWIVGRHHHVAHAAAGSFYTGSKAPKPGPPPAPPPGACPQDMMWDPVNQECTPVLPWPIQQN